MPAPNTQALVPRPGVAGRLRQAIEQGGLTVVHAPAGYGKSSTVALALAEGRATVAWYTAQLWHAHAFVEPLVDEVRRVRPDFGRLTLALAMQGGDTTEASAQRLGATFAAELGHVIDPLVVVLDDVQLLAEDRAFTDFLAGVLRARPDHVRFVVAARTLPANALAEWVVREGAQVFGPDILRLSAEETRSLASASGVAIDGEHAATVTTRFDGWPAGLALYFRAADRTLPADGDSLSALRAYVISANLDALGAEQRRFLEDSSAFETLAVAVLERDPAFAAAHRILQELERGGIMLATLRPAQEYRLHPLLREALIERVQRSRGASAVGRLHERAGRLYEDVGQFAAALYHYECSANRGAAVRLLAERADAMFAGGHGERAAQAASRLEAEYGRHPALMRVEAMALRQRGDPAAGVLLERALAEAQLSGDSALALTIRLLVAEDRLAHDAALDRTQLEALVRDAARHGSLEEAIAQTLAGWERAIAFDFAAALEYARQAVRSAGPSLALRARAVALEAYAATCLGEFEAADLTLASILRDLESSDSAVLLANALVWYARIALLWGDASVARDYAEQGEALARTLDLPAERTGAALALAEVAANLPDVSRCVDAAAQAQRYAAAAWYAADRARAVPVGRLFVARALFATGDARGALDVLAPETERTAEVSAVHAAALADTAAFAGGANSAPDAVRRAREAVAEAGARDALDAVLLADAERALGLPARHSVHTTFGPLLRRRPPLALQAQLRAGAGRSEAGRGSELTARESEVLALLADGLTNREMAQRLAVGTRTIDTHVERILGKLAVASRTRAVAVALRGGLVPPPLSGLL